MLIVPLGLATRIAKFPVVSAAVVACWILLFVVRPNAVKGQLTAYDTALSHVPWTQAKAALYVEFCTKNVVPQSLCLTDSRAVVAGDREKGESNAAFAQRRERGAQQWEQLVNCKTQQCILRDKLLVRFTEEISANPSAFSLLPRYRAFQSANVQLNAEVLRWAKREGVLVRGNVSIKTLLSAQFKHVDVMHLLGNAIVFMLFAIYVEAALPMGLLAPVLLLAGTVGMYLESRVAVSGSILLGGSAMVSAVLGMFYVLFYQTNMRIFCWIPFTYRFFRAPVRYLLPFLMVLPEIVGLAATRLGGSQIAYLAHLGGFAAGVCIALLARAVFHQKKCHYFFGENKATLAIEYAPSISHSLSAALDVLAANPDNVLAVYIISRKAGENWEVFSENPQVKVALADFWTAHLASFFSVCVKTNQLPLAVQAIKCLPWELPIVLLAKSAGQTTLLTLADAAAVNGEVSVALRLYDAYLTRYPRAHEAPQVFASVQVLLEACAAVPEIADELAPGLRFWTTGAIRALYQKLYPQEGSYAA